MEEENFILDFSAYRLGQRPLVYQPHVTLQVTGESIKSLHPQTLVAHSEHVPRVRPRVLVAIRGTRFGRGRTPEGD